MASYQCHGGCGRIVRFATSIDETVERALCGSCIGDIAKEEHAAEKPRTTLLEMKREALHG